MAYNRPPEDQGSELVEYQLGLNYIGDVAINDSALELITHTSGLFSIDLLELAYTTTEAALDACFPTLQWTNPDHSNDSGKTTRDLTLNPNSANVYFMEYNVPVNLYKFNGVNHRQTSQVFRLLITKYNGTRMQTNLFRARFRIRYYKPTSMQFDSRLMGTVLNAPT